MPHLSSRRAQLVRAVAVAVAALIPLTLLYLWVVAPIADCPDAHWVLQSAGHAEAAADIPIGTAGCDVNTSLVVDLVFILGYAAIFTWLIDRGGRRLRSLPGRRLARRLRWLPSIVALLDVVENALMAQWALPDGYSADWEARWVAAVSMPRWALTMVTVVMVAGAIWALADDG